MAHADDAVTIKGMAKDGMLNGYTPATVLAAKRLGMSAADLDRYIEIYMAAVIEISRIKKGEY